MLKCNVFIVPNAAVIANPAVKGSLAKRWNKVVAPEYHITEPEILIQVWMTSEECDDWRHHDGPVSIGYIPLKYAVVCEGDEIRIVLKDGTELVMTAAQQCHRYRNFGNWEDCLSRVLVPNWCLKDFDGWEEAKIKALYTLRIEFVVGYQSE